MPAKLKSDDGRNIIIRPLVYVAEQMILSLADEWVMPRVSCNACGAEGDFTRIRIKKLLTQLAGEIDGLAATMITAQKNIRPSQLLDQRLWDFHGLVRDFKKTN